MKYLRCLSVDIYISQLLSANISHLLPFYVENANTNYGKHTPVSCMCRLPNNTCLYLTSSKFVPKLIYY